MGVRKHLKTPASSAAAHIVTTTQDIIIINADKQRLVAKYGEVQVFGKKSN
jgi:hypothetical protein